MEKRITPTKSSTLTSPQKPTSPLYIDQFPPSQPTPAAPPANPTPQAAPRPRTWVRTLRAFLWMIVTVTLALSLSLRAHGNSSAAFTNGTSGALRFWSNLLFWPACVLGILNFCWGATRWFLRWRREHWRPGQVAGKLIGGGIWRSCVFFSLALFSLLLITPPIFRLISRNTITAQAASLENSASLLASAYSTNEIDADTYLNYLLDAIYNPSALPASYQSSTKLTLLPDYLTFADEHFSELDPATAQRTLELATLANVDFDTDASDNSSTSYSLFSTPAYAFQKATTLNKAQLSSDGHFVVFYTDTGNDAVSDSSISSLCDMLERIIKNYQDKIDLAYEYQLFTTNNSKTKKMSKVLEANGIAPDITNTAMAVYITDPYDGASDVLATYAGRNFAETTTSLIVKLGNIIGDETAKFYNTTPAYPLINILPVNLENKSLEIVTAHELGHHYATTYCYTTYNKSCHLDNFIDETVPNWFAVNVATNQAQDNVISGHHSAYVEFGTCYNISTTIPKPPKEHACHGSGSLGGYPAAAFLQNYSEIVPGSAKIFLDAIATGNALQKLYDAAGPERYQKVMTQLTERNLTKDYQQNTFRIDSIPRGEEIPCTDLCTQSYYIASSSSRYLYFPTTEYKNVNLEVSAPGSNTINILGQRGSSWTVISSGDSSDSSASYDIAETSDYDVVAFAITNYSISEDSNFTLKVTAAPLEELIVEDEPTAFDPNGLPIIPLSDNCIGINFENVIDFPLKLYRAFSQLDPSQDYSELFAQIEAENADLKSQLVYRYATICISQLKPTLDFDTVRASLKHSFQPSLELFRVDDPDLSLSMIAAYNPLQLSAKFYFLTRTDGNFQLFTVRMFEKIPLF